MSEDTRGLFLERFGLDDRSLDDALGTARRFAISTRGTTRYDRVRFRSGDALLFGPETRGLPQSLLDEFGPERLMWASDGPFQVVEGHHYKPSIDLIKNMQLSDGDRQWLLAKTAEEVFF